MEAQIPSVRIARIVEIPRLTHIHTLSLMRFHGEQIGVNLRSEYSVDPGIRNLLRLQLQVVYTWLHNQIVRPLCEYGMEIDFDLEDVGIDLEDGEILLPEWLARITLSTGIGALRGMLAVATRNTFLINYPMPLFDLSELIEGDATLRIHEKEVL